jgi:hypothetical protein
LISVLALDRRDGWVFAKEGERIVLLRPPYRLDEAERVSESVVARSVTHDGYDAYDREFPEWAEVVQFVRGEVARQRAADGHAPTDENAGRAFLRSAPKSTINRFLERVEKELIPRGELNDAAKILRAVLDDSPRSRESPEIKRRAEGLLADVVRRQDAARYSRSSSEERPPPPGDAPDPPTARPQTTPPRDQAK